MRWYLIYIFHHKISILFWPFGSFGLSRQSQAFSFPPPNPIQCLFDIVETSVFQKNEHDSHPVSLKGFIHYPHESPLFQQRTYHQCFSNTTELMDYHRTNWNVMVYLWLESLLFQVRFLVISQSCLEDKICSNKMWYSISLSTKISLYLY